MFGFFRKNKPSSAQQAKERLQILLAHERGAGPSADYLPELQREILEVIRRFVTIERDDIDIRMDKGDDFSSLEINIELPLSAKAKAVEPAAKAETKPEAVETEAKKEAE